MDTTAGPVKEEKKKLSHKEKVLQQKQEELFKKVNQDAARTQKMLCDKFFEFLIKSDDPDGDAVPEAFNRVDQYCQFVMGEYKKERYGQPKVEDKKEEPKPEEPPSA